MSDHENEEDKSENKIEQKKLITRTISDNAGEKISQVKMAYLAPLVCTISLGSIIFGFSIGSWNSATNAYFQINPADDDADLKNKQGTI